MHQGKSWSAGIPTDTSTKEIFREELASGAGLRVGQQDHKVLGAGLRAPSSAHGTVVKALV